MKVYADIFTALTHISIADSHRSEVGRHLKKTVKNSRTDGH